MNCANSMPGKEPVTWQHELLLLTLLIPPFDGNHRLL